MKSIYDYTSFRTFLQDEFEERLGRRKHYSLRAFARDIDASFSRLSEFLNANSSISVRTGATICASLKLTREQTGYLLDLIQAEFSTKESVRERAGKRAAETRKDAQQTDIRNSHDVLRAWYYLPLIQLITMKSAPSVKAVAAQLGLKIAVANEAVAFLEANGFIKKAEDGRWEKTTENVKFESPAPSKVIRDYHAAYLAKARVSLKRDAIERRKFLTWVFPLSDVELAAAREELEAFSSQFIKKYSSRSDASSVYTLGVQLYEVPADETL